MTTRFATRTKVQRFLKSETLIGRVWRRHREAVRCIGARPDGHTRARSLPGLGRSALYPTYRRRIGHSSVSVLLLVTLLIFTLPAQAATTWTVVPGAASRIGFSGEHAGNTFKGIFEKWEAVIAFDPADLAGSKAVATIALASAKTGDPTYDKTMPTVDWFDTARGPTAVFESTAFRAKGGDDYEADGTLTIRGLKVPVTLGFTFKATGDTATLTGKTQLKRLDFGIGKGSDGDGSWVSLIVPVELSVALKK